MKNNIFTMLLILCMTTSHVFANNSYWVKVSAKPKETGRGLVYATSENTEPAADKYETEIASKTFESTKTMTRI